MLGGATSVLPASLAQAVSPGGDAALPLPPASDVASTLFYGLLIVAAAVAVGIVAFSVRKKLTAPDEPDARAGLGFTLADLRKMHDASEIDDAEFARAKAKMVAHARADLRDDEELDDGALHLDPSDTTDAASDDAFDDETDDADHNDGPSPR